MKQPPQTDCTSQTRRSFDDEFKRQAIALMEAGRPVPHLARELEVTASMLDAWKCKFGSSVSPSTPGPSDLGSLQEENRSLKAELARPRHREEILKNARHPLRTKRQRFQRTVISYVPTDEGWLSVTAIMDAYSRKIFGRSCSSTLATGLCLEALKSAPLQRRPPAGLIHHSDRGVQYASHEYRQALLKAGLTQSMSRKANCDHNAMIEPFWSHLEIESTAGNHFKTRAQARLAVLDFIECFGHPHRRRRSIGGVSPDAFETLHN